MGYRLFAGEGALALPEWPAWSECVEALEALGALYEGPEAEAALGVAAVPEAAGVPSRQG